jgi:hypothetical protein
MGRVHGWFLLGGVGLLAASPAHADDYDLHLVVNGTAAATDNVFSAPDEGMASRDADIIYTLTPGLVASYGTPRTTHELSFNVALNGYVDHSEAWGVQVFGDYRAATALSPRTDLALSAGLSRGTTNALVTQAVPSDGTAAPAQDGEVDQLSVRADQSLTHALSPEMSVRQGFGSSYTIVTDPADNEVATLQLGLSGGLDRSFQFSSAGVDFGVAFLDFDRGEVMSMSAEPDRRADGRIGARYRRDLSQRWSAGVDGGLAAVIPIDGETRFIPVPVASASVNYVPEWGTASLSIGRAVSANPFIGQQTVAETAVLSLNLPLPWLNRGRISDQPEWTASAALAAARSRIINTEPAPGESDLTGELVNGLLDVGVSYVPREEMTFALRFQHTRQKTLEAIEDADGMVSLPTLSRSTMLFTFTYRYPGRIETRLSARPILRVDQETPLTERDGERRGARY